jgi:oxygen-independent coproporphyrinogen-3 oxidase
MITQTVRTEDGVDLALHHLAPAPSASATAVLLVHGAFTSHAVWLRGGAAGSGLAWFLSNRGLDVWLADLRHHGGSAREPRPRTWHFEDTILHDAPALVARVRRQTGGAPLVWVGHSVGGAIGLAHSTRDPAAAPAGIVALGTPGPVIGPLRLAMALLTIVTCWTLGRFPARALRMGSEDEAALVLAEWMAWNARGRWVGADGTDYLAALGRVRTPFLAVAGAGDRVFAPADACRRLIERAGAEPKRFVVAGPGLDHRGLLLDARADEQCWPLVADWIARLPVAARPPARMAP